MMNNEFIIPVTDETRSIKLFPDESKHHSLPGVDLSTSLKPRVNFSPVGVINRGRHQYLHSPQIPLGILKEKAISMLTEAVQGGGTHIRDPVGGSVQYQFVPILKLIGTLLIMGVLTSEEVRIILLMIDPNVFGEGEEAREEETGPAGEKEEVSKNEEKSVEAGEEETKESKPSGAKGLLEKLLPEPVKRQVRKINFPISTLSLFCLIFLRSPHFITVTLLMLCMLPSPDRLKYSICSDSLMLMYLISILFLQTLNRYILHLNDVHAIKE